MEAVVTPATALVLLGFGIGALMMAAGQPNPRTLREQALDAQKTSAQAAQRARELMEKWNKERAG
jgi:hypothetical protein